MNSFENEDAERVVASLVTGIGKRLQRDLPIADRVPFKMALLIEHLRRSEEHSNRGAGNS
jgi:hypothetical protein